MRKIFIIIALLSSALFASNIEVSKAYIKLTPPHAKNTAIFLNITNNTDKDIALIAASSPQAKVTELHTHAMVDGKMEMHQVKQIMIKAHSTQALAPGGFHIMLFNILKPVNADTKAQVTLDFSDKTQVVVEDIPAGK